MRPAVDGDLIRYVGPVDAGRPQRAPGRRGRAPLPDHVSRALRARDGRGHGLRHAGRRVRRRCCARDRRAGRGRQLGALRARSLARRCESAVQLDRRRVRQAAVERFDYRRMVDAYEELYRRLARPRTADGRRRAGRVRPPRRRVAARGRSSRGLRGRRPRVAIVSMTRGERGPSELPGFAGRPGAGRGPRGGAAGGGARARRFSGGMPRLSRRRAGGRGRGAGGADACRAAGARAAGGGDQLLRRGPLLAPGPPRGLALSRSPLSSCSVRRRARTWLYGATWPEGHAGRLVSLMRARGLAADLWGLEPDAFGAPADSITTLARRAPVPPREAGARSAATPARSARATC